MNKKLLALIVGASILPVGTNCAWAADDTIETGTVVVTGSRTEMLIEDSPSAMSVVTAEEIQRSVAKTAMEALQLVPGLSLDAGGTAGVLIRGSGSTETVFLINGKRVGGTDGKNIARNLLGSINVDNIERIEVLRGQAMYGASAMGGVVNIITKDSKEQSTTLSVTANSGGDSGVLTSLVHDFGQINEHLSANIGISYNALISHNDTLYSGKVSNGNADGSYSYDSPEGNQANVNAHVAYDFNDDHGLAFDLLFDQKNYFTGSDSSNADKSMTYSDTDKEFLQTSVGYRGNTGDHSYSFDIAYSSTISTNDTTKADDIYTTTSLYFQDNWDINDWNTLSFGGEYVTQYSKATSSDTVTAGVNTLDSMAVWIQDEIMLFDQLILLPTVRYDHAFDMNFGGQATANIGATWEFIPDQRLKGNIGTAYIAPTLVQLYETGTSGKTYMYANPDLTPETSLGWDISFEGSYSIFNYSVLYYRTEIDDMIDTVLRDGATDPSGNNYDVYDRVNIAEATLKGVETEFGIKITDNWKATLAYTWTDCKDGDGEDLSFRPKDQYQARLEYYNPDWDFSAMAWGHYYHDYHRIGEQYFSFYTTNIALTKKFYDDYTVSLAVYNAFATNLDNNIQDSVAPLECRLGFTMKF